MPPNIDPLKMNQDKQKAVKNLKKVEKENAQNFIKQKMHKCIKKLKLMYSFKLRKLSFDFWHLSKSMRILPLLRHQAHLTQPLGTFSRLQR